MTTKKTFISIFTLCIALLFTACGTQDSAGTTNTKDSVTKAGTEASDNSNARLNDLYQQENQLFAKPHHLSAIYQVKILMAILLMKVYFQKTQ